VAHNADILYFLIKHCDGVQMSKIDRGVEYR